MTKLSLVGRFLGNFEIGSHNKEMDIQCIFKGYSIPCCYRPHNTYSKKVGGDWGARSFLYFSGQTGRCESGIIGLIDVLEFPFTIDLKHHFFPLLKVWKKWSIPYALLYNIGTDDLQLHDYRIISQSSKEMTIIGRPYHARENRPSFFCQLLSQTLQYWHIASVAQEPWQKICILPGSVAKNKNKNNSAWKSSRTQMVSRILRKIRVYRCLACIDVHIHRLFGFGMLIRELCPIIVWSKALFRLLVESKRYTIIYIYTF